MKAILALLMVLVGSTAHAQVLLKDGEVRTVSGEVLKRGSVLIDANGVIQSVDSVIVAPPGYDVVDCRGKVITPGLIEVGTSLGAVEIWAVSGTRDNAMVSDPIRAAFRVADALNPASTVVAIALQGGITSAVTHPSGGLIAGQSAWIDILPDTGHASLRGASVAMVASVGESTKSALGETRGGVALTLREVLDDARFLRKNAKAFDENRSRTLAASRLDLMALQDALDRKIPVVVHADRASDIRFALQIAQEFSLRLIVSGAAEGWMVAKELAAAKVPVIVNPLENLPSTFEALGAREDNAALLAAAGVPIVLSTFDTHRARALRTFAGNAVRGGLSDETALAAITLAPARAFGMDDKYGSLAAGKVANVVVWDGDPFEPLTQVSRIYVGGKAVSIEDRQDQLFEKYRDLPRRAEPAEQN